MVFKDILMKNFILSLTRSHLHISFIACRRKFIFEKSWEKLLHPFTEKKFINPISQYRELCFQEILLLRSIFGYKETNKVEAREKEHGIEKAE